jgi:CHASE3 domain sensor protein
MKKFFSRNWIVIAVSAIAIAQVVNMGVSIRNMRIIEKNNKLQQQVDLVKQRTGEIITNTIHGIDLGVRGFALTKDNKLLDPFSRAQKSNGPIFDELEYLLKQQEYADLSKFYKLRKVVDEYFITSEKMNQQVRDGNMDEFARMLKEDKGYGVWLVYSDFRDPLLEFEKQKSDKAIAEYSVAMKTNLYLQVLIVLFSLPVLFLIVMRIQKEKQRREGLLKQVEENDKNFVFNPGIESNALSDAEIIGQTIQNTRRASNFVKNMANSNYDVEWEGLNEANSKLNNETLAGDLINMREQLKRVKKEDEKRNWMNEGLASFSELVRNNQHDSQLLADKCVSYLAKYLNSQQASLFILSGSEEDQHLSLVSCYAFDKKKWVEKRVELGSGLVGQAFLEGETIQLKEIPKGYTAITSGLGDATPSNLIIVPLKYDVHTVALIELASFNFFEPHHIMFLQKAGEFLASAILSSQNTQKMKNLLEHAKINEEQMKQREEEMRQNMEELQATQEELVRKEKEMQKRIEESKMLSGNF